MFGVVCLGGRGECGILDRGLMRTELKEIKGVYFFLFSEKEESVQ
jgi:hypothetical protein